MSRFRNLASDTLIYGVFTSVGRFLTFLLVPLYTNYISVSELGAIQYIFTILAILNIIYGFGMGSAYLRFYKKDDIEQSNKVFTIAYVFIAIISFASSIAIIIFSKSIAPFVTDLPIGPDLIILAAIIPFLDALMIIPYSYLRMSRHARKFALTKFILVIIAVAFNFYFVVGLKLGAKGILYAQIIANALGAAYFVPMLLQKFRKRFDLTILKNMILFGLPTIPAMLFTMILQVGDSVILKPLTNANEFAIYQVNRKMAIPMILFVSVFEYAWKPFYLSHFKDKDAKQLYSRVLTYFTLISAGIFLLASMFMEYVVRLPFFGGKFINPHYWEGMVVIPIILVAFYFSGVYNNFACGFHIQKKTKYLPIAVSIAAILDIILNFIFIPRFGYIGAAWATMISFSLSAFSLYLFARKIYPIKYEWLRLLKIVGVTATIYFLAMHYTQNMTLWYSFGIRSISLFVFVGLLALMGFFTTEEISRIKHFFNRKA